MKSMQFIQKNVFGLALIALAVLVGGGVAFAKSSTPAPSASTSEAETAAEGATDIDEPRDVDNVDDSDAKDEKGDGDQGEVSMTPQAGTISEARAIEIATATYTGNGTRTDIKLETEKGVLVYAVEFTEKSGNEVDVKLNAKTGAVVLIESDETDGEQDNDK